MSISKYLSHFSLLLLIMFSNLQTSYGAEPLPDALKDLSMNPPLGAKISLDTKFQDETGKTVALGQYFDGKRPVALVMAYYECPMLCGIILTSARDSFTDLDWQLGEQYQVVTVSFDPREKFQLAAAKKKAILNSVKRKDWAQKAEQGWHFLVGPKESSEKLAKELDFRYRWIEEDKQFAHGAAFFLLSPEGKLTRVLFGSSFVPRDLKLGLLEASAGKIGTIAEKLLLFCYHYEPKSNKYALLASRLVKAAAAVLVFLFILVYLKLYLQRKKRAEP